MEATPVKEFRYTEEFKRRAVQRVLAGESVSAVAKDLKVSIPSIPRWLKEYNINSEDIIPKVDKSELADLKKQVEQLFKYNRRLETLLIAEMMKHSTALSVMDRAAMTIEDRSILHEN